MYRICIHQPNKLCVWVIQLHATKAPQITRDKLKATQYDELPQAQLARDEVLYLGRVDIEKIS